MRVDRMSPRERQQQQREAAERERVENVELAVAAVTVLLSPAAGAVALLVSAVVRSWATWVKLTVAALLVAGWHVWRVGVDEVAAGFFAHHGLIVASMFDTGDGDWTGTLWRLLVDQAQTQAWLVPAVAMIAAAAMDLAPGGRPLTAALMRRRVEEEARRKGKRVPRRRKPIRRVPAVHRHRPVFGVLLDGDLQPADRKHRRDGWVVGDFVSIPRDVLLRGGALVGAPGTGKTNGTLLLAEHAFRYGCDFVHIDVKGTAQDLAVRLAVLADEHGVDLDDVRVWPDEPYDLWRGTGKQIAMRVLAAVLEPHDNTYFRQVVQSVTFAACAGDPPPDSATEFMRRAEQAAEQLRVKAGRDGVNVGRDAQTALTRLRALFAAVADDTAGLAELSDREFEATFAGPFDGAWALEDARVAAFRLAGLGSDDETRYAGRLLLADVQAWIAQRKQTGRQVVLVVDELGTLGAHMAKPLVEKARESGVGVWLTGQSDIGLGDKDQVAAVLQSVAALVLLRVGNPRELVKLAGTVDAERHAWQVDDGEVTATGVAADAQRFKVDPNDVLRLDDHQGFVITRGRAGLVHLRHVTVDAAAVVDVERVLVDRVLDVDVDGDSGGDSGVDPAAVTLVEDGFDGRVDVGFPDGYDDPWDSDVPRL